MVVPAGTVIVPGASTTPGALLDMFTTTPPGPATDDKETPPVSLFPPITVVAFSVTLVIVSPATFNVAVLDEPLAVAVITVELLKVIGLAVAVKVAVVLPPDTVVVAGTVATLVLLLLSETTTPEGGATAPSVTVPVEVPLEGMVVGDRITLATLTGAIVRVAVLEELLNEAVIVEVVVTATELVETVKLAALDPTGTGTVLLTVAEPLLLDKPTKSPPLGAALVSVTVPVEGAPPVTVPGFKATLDIVGPLTVNVAVCDEVFSVAVSVTV
jgi:hypothetical protein